MEFDSFTVSLLVLRDDAPEWDEETADAMQDAHLDHLANLHEQGHLLAAGPLGHDRFRGPRKLGSSKRRTRRCRRDGSTSS